LKTKTGNGGQKGKSRAEENQGRRTWEDCVIDAARRKEKTFVELKRLARDRIAFRKWTEDPKLLGNRDR
jgi:hypothetical protein